MVKHRVDTQINVVSKNKVGGKVIEYKDGLSGIKEIETILITDIDLDDRRFQNRVRERINDLQKSLCQEGQLVPVVLWGEEPPYKIIDGYRRIAAIKANEWKEVKAIIYRTINEEDASRLSLVENITRKGFTSIDMAHAAWRAMARSKLKAILTIGTLFLLLFLVLIVFIRGLPVLKNTKYEQDTVQVISEKNVVMQSLQDLTTQIGNVEDSVSSVNEQLAMLGAELGLPKGKRLPESFYIALQANESLAHLTTNELRKANQKITVQFFPKDIDQELVIETLEGVLKGAGFLIKTGVGNPELRDVPTNSIWYGASVPDDSIRIVALALLRSGVKIRSIQPISNPTHESKTRLIQIGSYSPVLDEPPYTVEQVNNMIIPRY